jgi:hypothetical protein
MKKINAENFDFWGCRLKPVSEGKTTQNSHPEYIFDSFIKKKVTLKCENESLIFGDIG